MRHFPDCGKGFLFDDELQLRSKTDRAHHAKRIVVERFVRIYRGSDEAVPQILHATKRIHEHSVPILIQAPRHCVDREVSALLIVLKRPIFDDRLA